MRHVGGAGIVWHSQTTTRRGWCSNHPPGEIQMNKNKKCTCDELPNKGMEGRHQVEWCQHCAGHLHFNGIVNCQYCSAELLQRLREGI